MNPIKNLTITILAGAAGICAARVIRNLLSDEADQVPVARTLGFFVGSLVAEMTTSARAVIERQILEIPPSAKE